MSDRCPQILLCLCGSSKLLADSDRQLIQDALLAAGRSLEIVPDLCGLIAERDPRLAAWAAHPLTIVACFDRGVRSLFAAAGLSLHADTRILNLRQLGPAGVLQELRLPLPAQAQPAPKIAPPAEPNQWMPWFPVIDRTRCVGCRQCLSFCLFGVYAMDGDTVRVAQPRNCKPYCPACARVCPQMAIIFPKHDQPPINGDVVRPEDLAKKVDIPTLAKTDLRQALAARQGGVALGDLQARAQELAQRMQPADKPKDPS